MLLLTRRAGETIKIGEDITVTLKGFRQGQAIVVISAPKDVAINRDEIYQSMMEREGRNVSLTN